MRGGFVVESAQHTRASCLFKVQAYPELTLTASRWPEWSVPQRVTYEIRGPIAWGTAWGTAFYCCEIAKHRAYKGVPHTWGCGST